MNLRAGNNIVNAVKVIRKTYENINKMMTACQGLADGSQTSYLMVTDAKHFLRYKSDRDLYGWFMSNFILLYQHNNTEIHGNEIFGMDINLEEGWIDGKPAWGREDYEGKDSAAVCLVKYVYDDAGMLSIPIENISPADHWKFYDPLYALNDAMDEIEEKTKWGYVIRRTVKLGNGLSKYMNVKHVIYTAIPLVDINADNLNEKIFGTFDKIAEL
ncbi:MAG: hypothetical protein J6O13_00760 [Selenomonas sp.]|nr:hypothetical protein [Selenomonas sp.]